MWCTLYDTNECIDVLYQCCTVCITADINSRDNDFHFQVKHYWCSATDSSSLVNYNARGFVQRNNSSTSNSSNASTGTIAQLFKQCTNTIIKAHKSSSSCSSAAATMTQSFSNHMDNMLDTLATAKVYHVRYVYACSEIT
jgi:hypothetical protein